MAGPRVRSPASEVETVLKKRLATRKRMRALAVVNRIVKMASFL
jgi:hypothetical protein